MEIIVNKSFADIALSFRGNAASNFALLTDSEADCIGSYFERLSKVLDTPLTFRQCENMFEDDGYFEALLRRELGYTHDEVGEVYNRRS